MRFSGYFALFAMERRVPSPCGLEKCRIAAFAAGGAGVWEISLELPIQEPDFARLMIGARMAGFSHMRREHTVIVRSGDA